MILPYLAWTVILAIPLSAGWAQSRIGEWSHHNSYLSVSGLVSQEHDIVAATKGGVLTYHPENQTFASFGLNEGLDYPDLQAISLAGDWLWLGGGEPQGIIQVLNLQTGQMDKVDVGLDAITHITAIGDRGFAAFRVGQEQGVVELRWDGQRYAYHDIYRNFPVAFTTIRDLDITGDSIFVSTDGGVLTNDHRQGNLKDPSTWSVTLPGGVADIWRYHIDSTGHYLLVRGKIYRRSLTGWSHYLSVHDYNPRGLLRRSNGDFVIPFWDYVQSVNEQGSWNSPKSPGRTEIKAVIEVDGQLFIAPRNRGLAYLDTSAWRWHSVVPNTMSSNLYAAVLKLSDGALVAAGLDGIARYQAGVWYNLKPGIDLLSGPEDHSRIHDNSLVERSPYFLADTIYFRGRPTWNMVELPDHSLMVGLRGSYPGEGGILHFSFDDLDGYRIYDTTDAVLDGLVRNGRIVYTTVRHMALDSQGNVWISNPYSELQENVLTVYTAEREWHHFSVPESGGSLSPIPTEVAFDPDGRVWIGGQEDPDRGSRGGIAVLDYGDSPVGKDDDVWKWFSLRSGGEGSNTVLSLVFDRRGELWVLTSRGVMGYTVGTDLKLKPVTSYGFYLSDIPFGEGAKIRVDGLNNKWITSPQHGLWVLLENSTFWPSIDGINTETSDLPSDEVTDIYLDNQEGLAYITTGKGISVLRMPFREEPPIDDEMIVFPSPFRIPSDRPLVIDGLRQGVNVKVFTATGRLVRELSVRQGTVQGYQAFWDGRNASGEWVGTGVYLIAAYLESGRQAVSKVAVIRR